MLDHNQNGAFYPEREPRAVYVADDMPAMQA